MAKRTQFYVYALIDPRDLMPFYVGKGSTDRLIKHYKIGKADAEGKSAKARRIRAIQKAGLAPISNIVSQHDTEKQALKAETSLIKKIGFDTLTNMRNGGGGDVSHVPKPRTLTPKQQSFCHAMASGKFASATDAYRHCYNTKTKRDKSVHDMAHKLLKDPVISQTIKELTRPVIERVQHTRETVIAGMARAADLAEDVNQIGVIVAAQREIGKLIDVYPAERKEVAVTDVEGQMQRLNKGRAAARRMHEQAKGDQTTEEDET